MNCVDNYDTGDVKPRNCDNVSLTQEVNNKIAGLVLKLKGKHNVSQTAVQTVVENVSDIIHVIQNHTRAAVQQHEVVSGCAPSTLLGFSDIIDGPLLDRKLQSQFMRDKYLVENLGMIQPQKVKLGESVRTHEQQVKTLSRYGYIVPFLPNLSKFLSCPEVMDELQHCNESTDGYMYDICDAEFIKDHPLYIEDQNFLKFMLNCDNFEVCNPVGSHTKVHKITVWYWLLLNIRPVYRSRLPVIQLLAIAKSSHIRQFGMQSILADFLEGLRELAAGIALPGLGIKKGALVVVVADTPAANQNGGFKEGVGFAARKCRTCNCSAEEMVHFFTENAFRVRTEEEHKTRHTLGRLSKKSRIFWSKEYGINSRSTLLDCPHFKITQCLVHDVMHVLFEGICPLELRLILEHVTKNYITLDEVNSKIDQCVYGSSWVKPMHIDRAIIHDSTKSLRQDSAQTWCLIMHLPVLIGKSVPVKDEKWKNFIRLQQIVILCMTHRTSSLTVAQLEHLIAVHNYMFVKLYKDVSYIPKLHFLVHIPTQIMRFGPARNMWAMRMEAKNGKFKRKKWSNFKNIPYSLSVFHQQSMCFEQMTGSGEANPFYLRVPDVVHEGNMVRLDSYQHADILVHKDRSMFNDASIMLTIPIKLTVHGIQYSRGSIIYYRRESEFSYPCLGSVADIVVYDAFKCLLLKPLDITMYNPHRNCYSVTSSHASVVCCKFSELWCPRPVIAYGKDAVISEDFVVEEL